MCPSSSPNPAPIMQTITVSTKVLFATDWPTNAPQRTVKEVEELDFRPKRKSCFPRRRLAKPRKDF